MCGQTEYWKEMAAEARREMPSPKKTSEELKAAVAVRVLRRRHEEAVREFNQAKARMESLSDALAELGAEP